jgi:quercetin dioxygenase-like cupin family protein
MRLIGIITFLCLITNADLYSQHGHQAPAKRPDAFTFANVLSQQLSDDLGEYSMNSSVMTIPPGATDTVAHRHDCELFGYVLEGNVNVGLNYDAPKSFKAGEMFYEKRNIIHSYTNNPNSTQPAKVLLIFIIKNGRQGYTRLHPEKK